ncbi:DNA polymerase III subunit chi [Thauera linaloolentis]|uniref:DNA polymerase III subunit chi n=1 Tax=Thauera linaloolentis (strain DSM 12138 / JCM 21573 / CCUG 41526 / CIP 105981 / IAM 15112 / NBRC 102519 / 47Lol) TaxID=1123367 RepID=N6Y3X6_THAL4|nr:DNA polymerase III subunit chi [Thauera linaloolentis]ENO86295.1 DNA polymerase III subunit chi [Thauera linaloolentis 47Lol = DSM 12138]MCM8567536.1 DNA polymerase III subunit chi [Thauera linaloolentis]
MAPSVRFYHNTPDRLALACELVARAYGSGRKVAVRMPDGASARELERVLWTREPLAFVPHVLRDSELAAETPVVIGDGASASPWPHADTLFNLAPDLPPDYQTFRIVVEIVGQTEAERLPARARWARYREQGLAPKAFDAERRVAL